MKNAAALAATLPLALLTACGGEDPETTPAPTGPAAEYAALVRGTLFTSDLAAAQTQHDGLAAGGEAQAKAAGDFAHDVGLGTGLFASTSTISFLGVDRWTDLPGMQGFYMDPDFGAAFAQLFAEPPTLELFERQHDFHSWGDLDAGGTGTRWIVVARGRLAAADAATRKAQHDAAAAGGEEMVRAAGDVAHVAYLSLEDDREFLAFDVWTDDTNIAAVYGDPDFQAAFGGLFEAPPTLQIYETTDWHQW